MTGSRGGGGVGAFGVKMSGRGGGDAGGGDGGLASVHTPYEFIPYDVSYGVSHTGSLGAFTNFKRASKSFTNLHKI